MSKKQDDFYFQNFIECAGYSCQAAHLLKEILSDFRPEDTRLRLDELHKIEHEADMKSMSSATGSPKPLSLPSSGRTSRP